MSRWLDHADALATYLIATLPWCAEALPVAERIPVLVDRKLELANLVAQTSAKERGAAIVILFGGAKNPDLKANALRTGGSYSVFVMTKPYLKNTTVSCDDLTEAVAEAMHGWIPTDTPNAKTHRMEVSDVDLVPDKTVVIYEISARVLRLPGSSSSPVGDWDADNQDWED